MTGCTIDVSDKSLSNQTHSPGHLGSERSVGLTFQSRVYIEQLTEFEPGLRFTQ